MAEGMERRVAAMDEHIHIDIDSHVVKASSWKRISNCSRRKWSGIQRRITAAKSPMTTDRSVNFRTPGRASFSSQCRLKRTVRSGAAQKTRRRYASNPA